MNIGEKLQHLIKTFEDGKKLKVSYTSSEDNHTEVRVFTWGSDLTLKVLKNSLGTFEKEGECVGSDPKGCIIRDIDFELV